ncbi:uncharacterized protein BDR25DRAFT_336618 [Lindgomyces ingoldianus]|uniref:Uncharacterized protein n=1 Tax=Lindgomyces ingoldianus TaxID=673940 RepID=A0ACB6QHR3_9PLEO|nr:uncharacterized protein BDR25DRAFT_336618 [Lindgomyces ingoldianus]KAF2466045.1 hypothetical protein BDR25DRAFT_336618 [Lindgomyces ingoldianus]
MLLSHIKRLCTLLPSFIEALPQHSDPSSISTSLPVPLQRSVPACAQPCLRDSLLDQFPLACTSRVDFTCLCSHYSTGGESLGEVALGCIYASCSTVDSSAASAYNICLGERNAVPPTQTVLTVTAASSIMSRPTLSTSVATITKLASTSQTSSKVQLSATNSVVVDSVLLTSTASPSPWTPSSSVPTAAEAEGPRTMKPAQIAGLSVAAAATFVLAIGLMVLSVCLRRRKERRGVTEIIGDEKRPQGPQREKFSARLSKRFSTKAQQLAVPQLKLRTKPKMAPGRAGVGLTSLAGFSDPYLSRANPNTEVYAVQVDTKPPQMYPSNFNSTHPAFRPGASDLNNFSNTSLPLEQIGLAISAELPAGSVPVIRPPQILKRPSLRQQRPKSIVRRSGNPFDRPDSVLTQDTVFEEDVPPERRRSSRLLPTPPIPILPIRTLQPPRPQPSLNPSALPKHTNLSRQQAQQQPELFLNIPVRHSRTQPLPVTLEYITSRVSPQDPAPSLRTSSVYDQHKSITTNASTPAPGNMGDIPDYYFMSNRSPPRLPIPIATPGRLVRPKESPKLVTVKAKNSASTVSRTTSRGSTNPRDSISSQTSFETVDPDDPTPEEDDDDKQLADDSKLSPVAESPISNLRYPKVPRASNQLVPRSPRSPHSLRSDQSTHSPRYAPEPSSLLVKRIGEQEALKLGGRLQMATGSPNREEIREHMKHYREHVRSNSTETAWSSVRSSERHTRTQSGQWPKSPAMYEASAVQPLNLNLRSRAPPPEMSALKSPAWVPRLTPTRHGDDLLISVTYSKPNH